MNAIRNAHITRRIAKPAPVVRVSTSMTLIEAMHLAAKSGDPVTAYAMWKVGSLWNAAGIDREDRNGR